jgi:HK97 gp10 family phage protein
MAEDFDVEVEGLAELGEALEKMPYTFAQRIQRAALHAAGDVMAAEVEARAPVAAEASHPESEPGELRNSIGVVVHLGKDLDESKAQIGPLYEKDKYNDKPRTHSPGVYGKFVEYGTSKMRAQPFMRPAYQAAKQRALEAYAKVTDALVHLLKEGATPKQLGE